MTDPDLLYPAIFVFAMLVVGLFLTVREFSSDRLRSEDERSTMRGPPKPSEVKTSRG